MNALVSRQAQSGIALLSLLFLFTIMLAGTLISAWNTRQAAEGRDAKTRAALQQAKDALIGYAANSSSAPGRLPCPEDTSAIGTANEGQAQSSCTTVASRLGRFPWRTLKTGKLVDSNGEALWYGVSPGFSQAPINSNTPGQLNIDGTPNAAVAIIIAPGIALGSQQHSQPSAANPPLATNYLDLSNPAGILFVTTGPAATFNDKVLALSHAELFATVNRVVLAEVRGLDDQAPGLPVRGLRRYFGDYGQFPWAAIAGGNSAVPNQPSGSLPYADLNYQGNSTWLAANAWFPLITYTRNSPNLAQIRLGTVTMAVLPCTALPCP